jgi:hypothetical protein
MFVKYRDGYVTTPGPAPVCGCQTNSLPYSSQWYDRIATETGVHYVMPEEGELMGAGARRAIPKRDLRAFL